MSGVVDFGVFVQVKGLQVDGLRARQALGQRLLLARRLGLPHGRRAVRTRVPARRSPARARHQRFARRARDRLRARRNRGRQRARRGGAPHRRGGAGDDERSRMECTPYACCSSGAGARATLWCSQKWRGGRALEELRGSRSSTASTRRQRDAAMLDRLAGNGRHQGVVAEIRARVPVIRRRARGRARDRGGTAAAAGARRCPGSAQPGRVSAHGRCCARHARSSRRAIARAGSRPWCARSRRARRRPCRSLPVVNLARTLRELKERGIWVVGTERPGARARCSTPT